MNCLSLFDGMSCGQIALEKANMKVDNYFASEIDKYAIEITQKNYPNTIQLGDIRNVYFKNTDIIWNKGKNFKTINKIDLLIGGSPCQGFSFAGKQLNFDDPRSKLFFEFVRLLKECKPKYFLLENVKMKKEYEQVVTEHLGVAPILINSASLTAHDRKRLYWTNIPNIELINKLSIVLEDILEDPTPNLFLKEDISNRYEPIKNYKINENKSCVIGKLSKYQGDRVFDVKAKGSSLSASGGNNGGGSCNIIHDPETGRLRKLSVRECERLQGVPDNYTTTIKRNIAYKALGNGWTVDVIVHILKNIKNEN